MPIICLGYRLFRKKIFRHSTTDPRDKNVMLTPMKDSPITPCSDKQILGFTFKRKQFSRIREDVHTIRVPTFKLTSEISEQNVF